MKSAQWNHQHHELKRNGERERPELCQNSLRRTPRSLTLPVPFRVVSHFKKAATSLLLLALFIQPAVIAQQAVAPAPGKPQTLAELQTRIAALLDQPQFASARSGARIITAKGAVVFERDADKVFTPASNMKLYTTAAALDAFGPEAKFKTSVYASKAVSSDGTLRGDLILYGRGDANLSARFENPDAPGNKGNIEDYIIATEKIPGIEKLADQLKARGVKRIIGDVVGDDSYFATSGNGADWEWDDLMFDYGAPISALTINDNAVTFVVKPAVRSGLPPIITVKPQTVYLRIVNQATTSRTGATRIGVHRSLDSNTVEFFGSIPTGAKEFEVNISIHDPASFATTLLKEALVRRGITISGRIRRMDAVQRVAQPFVSSQLIELASLQSPPMSAQLRVLNKKSHNLHAEILLRQLGVRALQQAASQTPTYGSESEITAQLDDYGRPKATEAAGIEALKLFLQQAGVETRTLSLRDGSGLSRSNLVSPRSTSRLLEFMSKHPHFATFLESLPNAGVDGTLERRMRATAAEGNVKAKTGTLRYTAGLSGYVYSKRGQMLIFSLMGNNYTGAGRDVTGTFDQICALLAEFEGEL